MNRDLGKKWFETNNTIRMNVKSGPIIETNKGNFLTTRIGNTKNLNTINIFNQ